VRVAIRAAALNHLDIFVRNGIPDVPLPQIPGSDGAGILDALGEGVTAGLRATASFCSRVSSADAASSVGRGAEPCVTFGILGEHVHGTLASNVVVPAANVFESPAACRLRRPAAFPLVYQTAWR